MTLLTALLADDPATPRLTFYNETTGARLDFSALTLDNWANKVANMLTDELDLEAGDQITVALPCSWQAACIVLGALRADMTVNFKPDTSATVLFCSPDFQWDDYAADTVLVTDDPFGRGIVELGMDLPDGTIDFGPTVRFYGDQCSLPCPPLAEHANDTCPPHTRLLSTGWQDWDSFCRAIINPLAVVGSAVVVSGPASTERLHHIAGVEKVTASPFDQS
ncbi:TIGR03089 family protein [Corynebacterium felinum]|nr:TIGR03089 family protein [Corynebacterium felinum]MDF5820250.1 TIGR03089 family protein [Corynebacterium felinum]WJY94252.1 hypothetical protein CFELI_03050 [Corynebacterium felinum]